VEAARDPEELLAHYLGRYRTESGEEFELVLREAATVALIAPGQSPVDLQPLSPTEAVARGLRTSVEFEFGEDVLKRADYRARPPAPRSRAEGRTRLATPCCGRRLDGPALGRAPTTRKWFNPNRSHHIEDTSVEALSIGRSACSSRRPTHSPKVGSVQDESLVRPGAGAAELRRAVGAAVLTALTEPGAGRLGSAVGSRRPRRRATPRAPGYPTRSTSRRTILSEEALGAAEAG
jgi:hypothetical protein